MGAVFLSEVLSNEGREREGRPRGKGGGGAEGGGGERETNRFFILLRAIPNDIPTDRQADAETYIDTLAYV